MINSENIISVFTDSLMITSFVIIMMLLIEYFNIKTRGLWLKNLKNNKFKQIFLGAFLGLIPGCVGGYALVSLYTHNIVGFGSLLAAFIATAGDETFVMLSLFPEKALLLMGILFVIGIVFGLLFEYLIPKRIIKENFHFIVHNDSSCSHGTASKTNILQNLKNISFQRALIIFGLIMFIILMVTGAFGHCHIHVHGEGCVHHANDFNFFVIEEWMQYSFIVLATISIYIMLIVPEHFLNEHLWKHIIKKHFIKVFLWILVSIVAIKVLLAFVDINSLFGKDFYFWGFVIAAIAIGIIPQSGPHIIFVSLFSQGLIPFSILLINSIVHEGHASLPLIAESKKSFFIVKSIKIIIALILAVVAYFVGF